MDDPSTSEPTVVHQDEHLLIVHKPPGLPTTSPTPSKVSLSAWVATNLPHGTRAHATSRLDSPVSGLVTFALTKVANTHLLRARAAGAYARVYLGITASPVAFASAEWTWPISIDPANAKRRLATPGKGERDACTRCELLSEAPSGSLLRLTPETGRTHQLRVHASEAKVPLFGDHMYGGPRRVTLTDGRVVTARRAMLHCLSVSFPRVDDDGAPLTFRATVDADFADAWRELGGSEEHLAS